MIDKEKDSLTLPFTLPQIKNIFWETFHKSGEHFFNYCGTDEDNERATYSAWEDLRDNIIELYKKGE